MNNIELAEVPLNYARMTVRDLVQQAYDAGKATRPEDGVRPSADEVNAAITAVERNAVLVAHARMEAVAIMCGFDGLAAALGYLQTLRTNPLAELLREAVNLAIVGDITPSDDVASDGGWGNWLKRATAVVGDKPPPDTETIDVEAHEAAIGALNVERSRPKLRVVENEVRSGCAVRAAIQDDQTGDAAADIAEHDEAMAKLYGNKGGATTDET